MLQELNRVSGKVLFQVSTDKGEVIGFRIFPEDKIGDSSARQEFKSLREAQATIELQKKLIERLKDHEIYKVVKLDQTKLYQVVSAAGTLVGECHFLKEARQMAGGIKVTEPTELTKPKSAYVQNTAGYKATGAKKTEKKSKPAK